MAKLAFKLSVLVGIVGCSQPPEIPRLADFSQSEIKTLRFSNPIRASEFRHFFVALNRTRKLESFRPLFEAPSDKELDLWVHALSQDILSDEDGDFLSLLEARVQNKTFSTLEKWLGDKDLKPEADLLEEILRRPSFASISSQNSKMLSVEGREIWALFGKRFDEKFSDMPWGAEPVDPDLAYRDLARFFRENQGAETLAWLGPWLANPFLLPFQRSAQVLLPIDDTAAIARLATNLAELTQPKAEATNSSLALTLELLGALSGLPNGFFIELKKKLDSEPDNLTQVATLAELGLRRSLGWTFFNRLHAKDKFADFNVTKFSQSPSIKPTKEFVSVFIQARVALQIFKGKALNMSAPGAFDRNLPIYASAYALTKWLQNQVAGEAGPFMQEVPKLKNFSFDFIERISDDSKNPPEVKYRLRPEVKAEMEALFGPGENGEPVHPFVQKLELHAAQRPSQDLRYRFNFAEVSLRSGSIDDAWKNLFELATEQTEEVAPTIEFRGPLQAFYTQVSQSQPSIFEVLEKRDLLHTALQWFPPDHEGWKYWRGILFEGLQLQSLSSDSREILLSLYADAPVVQERASHILDRFGVLLDWESTTTPSPLSFLQNVIAVAQGQLGTLVAPFLFLEQTKLLNFDEIDGKTQARYPALIRSISNPGTLARVLFFLNHLTDKQRVFLESYGTSWGPVGDYFELGKSLVVNQAPGVQALLHRVSKGDWPPLTVTDTELDWVAQFLGKRSYPGMVRFLQEHLPPGQIKKIADELSERIDDSSLVQILDWVESAQSSKFQRLAHVLRTALRNGELKALLNCLKKIS